MKSLIVLTSLLFTILVSCKKTNENSNKFQHKITNNNISDTIINGIDSTKIQTSTIDKKPLLSLFFKSFEKDDQENYVVFDNVKKSPNKITIKKYSNFIIDGSVYSSYLFSFPYENDNIYNGLLLTNKNCSDGLIIYEKVINEGEYVRTSKISKNQIKNIQYEIEYYNYDIDGNVLSNKQKRDSTVIISNQFEVRNGNFLPYFPKEKDDINLLYNKWFGTYKTQFDYGKIAGIMTGWSLEIIINEKNIIASGDGYQIAFKDELKAIERENKLFLYHKRNIDGYSTGHNMNPEFILINEDGKYYIQSKWIDSDVITKPEKNGFIIQKKK